MSDSPLARHLLITISIKNVTLINAVFITRRAALAAYLLLVYRLHVTEHARQVLKGRNERL